MYENTMKCENLNIKLQNYNENVKNCRYFNILNLIFHFF